MHSQIQKYMEVLHMVDGDQVTKMKSLIEQCSDDWGLYDDAFIVDILDDDSLTAQDVIESLKSIIEFEDVTPECRHAMLAMNLLLERDKQIARQEREPVKEDNLFEIASAQLAELRQVGRETMAFAM